MKLVHTADIHLDSCFAGAGLPAGFGNRRRQSLRDVLHSIVARAGAWPADALLIAGDLFEGDRVSRDTVAFLMAEFESIPDVKVFIAPGNHDPFEAASPYATETWPANVHIFDSPSWTAVALKDGGLTVHGFGFDGADISENPFGKLTIGNPDEGVHVAIGHGSAKGFQPPDSKDYAPFSPASAAVDGLSYLALGHFHSLTEVKGDFATTMMYPGAPEGHSFKETGPKVYLEVEIADGEAHVSPVRCSRVEYRQESMAVDDVASSQDVLDALREMAKKVETPPIMRVTLTGLCPPEIRSEFGSIYDAVANDFTYLDLVDKTEPLEDYEELGREETSLGAFVDTLNGEIANTTDEARKALLVRAREVGLAAFRRRELDVRGLSKH